MNKHLSCVLFAFPLLLLPGLTAARSQWGTLPNTTVPAHTRPQLPHPAHHAVTCHLDGTVWASGPAHNRNTDHMQLKLIHRWGGGQTLVYSVHNQYRPEEYATVVYVPAKNLVHIMRYYAPQKRISDDTGSLSNDCRHMSFSIVTSEGAFGSGTRYRER